MSEKINISYLKGLAEGQKIDEKSEEGKLLIALIDIVQEQNEKIYELSERVESLEAFRVDLDSSFREADDFMQELLQNGPGLPPFLGGDYDFDDDDDDDDEMDMYEVECPNCHQTYYASFEDFLDDDVVCPNCANHYELSDEVIQKLIKDNFDE